MRNPSAAAPTRDRNETILQMLRARRNLRVGELARILKVSEITIRRVLNDMAAEGLLRRTHGGAELIDSVENSQFFQTRAQQNIEKKRLLAGAAIECIPPNGSVYLDSGSTCFEIAKQLGVGGRPLTIVTDSILVLQELHGLPGIDAMILGGGLANDKVTVDGHLAVEAARHVSVDVCFFSANGFTDDQIANQYLRGVPTKKAMIERAKKSVCVSDSSKFNKQCCFHFCRWEDVDVFVTDSGLAPEIVAAIAAKGADVRVVEA